MKKIRKNQFKGLDKDKKIVLKKLIGSASSTIDFNKVKDEWKFFNDTIGQSNIINISEALYDCPLCDRQHKVTVITSKSKAMIKGRIVEFDETKYYCPNSQYDEKYFVPSYIMDENNQRARDAYRKEMNLLTSSEIKAIREKYSLTQKEMSNLLGWGDVTIQRYEEKIIQDETYDSIIRRLDTEPLFALEQFQIHSNKFENNRYCELVKIIK